MNTQLVMVWDAAGNVRLTSAPTKLHERAKETHERQLTLDTAVKTAINQTAWCKDTRKETP